MLPDIFDIFRNILHGLAFAGHEQAFPETEAADAAADIGEEKKAGLIIFVLQAGFFGIIFFTRRIRRSPGFEFPRIGNYDPAQRIVPVFPVDKREIILIGAEREQFCYRLHLLPLFGGEPDKVVEL